MVVVCQQMLLHTSACVAGSTWLLEGDQKALLPAGSDYSESSSTVLSVPSADVVMVVAP